MTTAIYERDGDTWRPRPEARGPFPGQHGGAVAGALAAAMESAAREVDAGAGRQLAMYLLRPVPVEPVDIDVREVRVGGRVAVLAADMRHGGEAVATAHAVFVHDVDIASAPPRGPEPMAPGDAPFDIGEFTTEPWYGDAVEMRADHAGRIWIRHITPIVSPMGPLSFVASLADWASGMTRPSWVDANRDVAGFPNADLTVHLHRRPDGEWLGIEGTPTWTSDGVGTTTATLYDRRGPLGRSAQSVVLVPAKR